MPIASAALRISLFSASSSRQNETPHNNVLIIAFVLIRNYVRVPGIKSEIATFPSVARNDKVTASFTFVLCACPYKLSRMQNLD